MNSNGSTLEQYFSCLGKDFLKKIGKCNGFQSVLLESKALEPCRGTLGAAVRVRKGCRSGEGRFLTAHTRFNPNNSAFNVLMFSA